MTIISARMIRLAAATAAALLSLAVVSAAAAQQPQGPARARFDVTHYRMEAELRPAEHILRAAAEVAFTPTDATRTVVFELNGSLKVEAIERNGKALTGWVQDPVGLEAIGPHVRVDLG